MNDRSNTDEPNWITGELLFALHAQQIDRYGGAHGMVDENVVHGALARPRNVWVYGENVDLAELAAVYLLAFVGSQGFADGNKRTGLACALVFLRINAVSVEIPAEELFDITMRVAVGQAREAEVVAFFRSRL